MLPPGKLPRFTAVVIIMNIVTGSGVALWICGRLALFYLSADEQFTLEAVFGGGQFLAASLPLAGLNVLNFGTCLDSEGYTALGGTVANVGLLCFCSYALGFSGAGQGQLSPAAHTLVSLFVFSGALLGTAGSAVLMARRTRR